MVSAIFRNLNQIKFDVDLKYEIEAVIGSGQKIFCYYKSRKEVDNLLYKSLTFKEEKFIDSDGNYRRYIYSSSLNKDSNPIFTIYTDYSIYYMKYSVEFNQFLFGYLTAVIETNADVAKKIKFGELEAEDFENRLNSQDIHDFFSAGIDISEQIRIKSDVVKHFFYHYDNLRVFSALNVIEETGKQIKHYTWADLGQSFFLGRNGVFSFPEQKEILSKSICKELICLVNQI
jgi:hypothetical protein